jgi:hypothetical protein
VTKSTYAADRALVRTWLIRSLLKASGIWGSGLDTLLTALREVLKKDGSNAFPIDSLQAVMARRGKPLFFTDEEINELVEMQYGDKRLFAMLALLFPFVDVRNNHFHVDHVFPKSQFTRPRLKKAGVSDEDIDDFQDMVNSLPNLQLLEGAENVEKLTTMPMEWIRKTFKTESNRTNYCRNHLLGAVSDSLVDFRGFYDMRREALRARIVEMVGTTSAEA